MKRVLLVALPMSPEVFNWPPALLSVGFLAAYARQDRWIATNAEIKLVSALVGKPGFDDREDEGLLQDILAQTPDLVGFSCYIWNYDKVRHLTQLIKAVAPQIGIIWGGPEVGFTPEEAMRTNPQVDVIVCGEGEVTFSELIKLGDLEPTSLRRIAGITYRDDGGICRTVDRPPLADLDAIPSPYLTGILAPSLGPKGRHLAIEGFRECPYRCGFCVSPGRPRFFSSERVHREIKYAFEQDVESFLFIDPYLNIRKRRLLDLADFLQSIDRGQKKMAACFVMAEPLDKESVNALARMNVPLVKAGLQSANPEVLKNIHLRLDKSRYRKSIHLLQEAGLPIHLQLIAGLPGDTLDGLKRTFDFVFELAPDLVSCYTPLLLPGSSLDRRKEELGIAFDPRPPHRILSHYSLTYDQMLECLEFGLAVCQEYNSLDRKNRGRVLLDMEAWQKTACGRRHRDFFSGW